ncbi:hypothetical protein GCM10009735_61470 [Actinomadura chokoriensis]
MQERDNGDVAVHVESERKEVPSLLEGGGSGNGQAVPEEPHALLVHLVVVHVRDLWIMQAGQRALPREGPHVALTLEVRLVWFHPSDVLPFMLCRAPFTGTSIKAARWVNAHGGAAAARRDRRHTVRSCRQAREAG